MGFSELERIQIAAKTLAASVKDADPTSQWYESTQFHTAVIPGTNIWTESGLLRANPAPGPGPASAQALAAGTLSGVVEDRSSTALQMSAVPGVNNTYVALSTLDDFSSTRLDNWISPQFVPLTTGYPSTGYAIRLYNGVPGPSNEVLTTDGTIGTGIDKTVGWFFDYAGGLLLLSDNFSTTFLSQTGNTWLGTPYITGFRYIGETAEGGSGSGHETLDTLVHNLAENAWTEYIYTGKNLTALTAWETSAKLKKLRDSVFTYTGKDLTGIVTRQYASDGITVVTTLTKSLIYAGKDLVEVTTTRS